MPSFQQRLRPRPLLTDDEVINTNLAFVDVGFAKLSGETQLALAFEAVDPVDAGCVVLAGVGLAFVNVDLAINA